MNKYIKVSIFLSSIIFFQGCQGENDSTQVAEITYEESKKVLERDFGDIEVAEDSEHNIMIKYNDRVETISSDKILKAETDNLNTAEIQENSIVDYDNSYTDNIVYDASKNNIKSFNDKSKNIKGFQKMSDDLNELKYIYTYMLMEEEYYDIRIKLDNINSLVYHYNIESIETDEILILKDKCTFLIEQKKCKIFLTNKENFLRQNLSTYPELKGEI